MPWCNEKLDATLEMVLTKMNIKKGTFLNLGTRLEHKQSHFLKEPLDLTGSDSLEKEVKKATKIFANNDNVNFIVNDILNSKIKEKEFNYILRPCFHAANWRARNISKKSKGY
jgi:hypothetical protein